MRRIPTGSADHQELFALQQLQRTRSPERWPLQCWKTSFALVFSWSTPPADNLLSGGEVLVQAVDDLRKPAPEVLIQRMDDIREFLALNGIFIRVNAGPYSPACFGVVKLDFERHARED